MEEYVDCDLADVADHVEQRVDDLVAAILLRVGALPGYSTGRRPGDREDIRAGFLASTRLFLACLRHDRGPSADELGRIALIGTQRARQGLPRESVSASLDHAERVGFEFVLGSVHRVAAEGEYHQLALRAWARLSEFMTSVRAALLGGYDEAEQEPLSGPRKEAAVFVARLLGRRWTSESEIRSHASSAGIVLGRSTALLLVVPVSKRSRDVLREAMDRLIDTVDGAVEGPVRWSPLLHAPVFISRTDDSRDPAFAAELGRLCAETGVSIASVGPTRSLTELADSFVRVEAKLRHLPGARSSPTVVDGRELDVLHVLTGEATITERVAFVRRVLGPLLVDDRADELVAVLEAVYATNGSASEVATALNMTKSTVQRRFRAIAQLTGRRLDIMCERYEVLTALRLKALLADELQSVD